ncbi:hypothetical protein M8C21_029576 [Ambrosia artemisiifolia]|uniref:Uncharacterized protein n=1 Tax=Ambrosia artemisiifolia TaxID=4212 RepID=A0AAD5CL64_AMBAR|nr:hypothetical protein M8C21_029576 [Ambrosia artemisiifolia]
MCYSSPWKGKCSAGTTATAVVAAPKEEDTTSTVVRMFGNTTSTLDLKSAATDNVETNNCYFCNISPAVDAAPVFNVYFNLLVRSATWRSGLNNGCQCLRYLFNT